MMTAAEMFELGEDGHSFTETFVHVPGRCERCLMAANLACPDNGLDCPGCRFCPTKAVAATLPPRRRDSDKYRRHKKAYCEDCGWVADYSCQLDVDHVDGNRANNAPKNLRTLCANCHRLKTAIERGLVSPDKSLSDLARS